MGSVKPTKVRFDIANIIAVRLSFSHPALGVVRDLLPLLVCIVVALQKLMDATLVPKISIPSFGKILRDWKQDYLKVTVPSIKHFRTLSSPMRDVISTVPVVKAPRPCP